MTTSILGAPVATVARAKAWATAHGATPDFIANADVYWELAPSRGGVRPDVAYAQTAKETGFGHFGGTDVSFSATAAMHNPAGLKTADGAATVAFPDWWQGITAHLDHLALYAGAPGYPRAGSPDQRQFAGIRGVCPNVEDLGGHYAPDPNYGTSIVDDYLAPMLAQEAPTVTTVPDPLQLDAQGRIVGPNVTWETPWPSPNGSPGRFVEPAYGMASHTEVGYEHSVIHEFEDPNAQASAFCSIGMDGAIHQYGPVGHGWMAWTQAAGNPHWRGVEHEDAGNPANPYTDVQLASSAQLLELFSHVDGFPIAPTDDPTNGRGNIFHSDGGAAWGGHDCPGDVRRGQRPAVIALAQQIRARRTDQPITQGGDVEMMKSVDPKNGSFVLVDPAGEVFTFAGNGAPGGNYLGGLNTHPDWHAGEGQPEGAAVAVQHYDDGDPTKSAYVIITRDAQGHFHNYNFPSNGSARG